MLGSYSALRTFEIRVNGKRLPHRIRALTRESHAVLQSVHFDDSWFESLQQDFRLGLTQVASLATDQRALAVLKRLIKETTDRLHDISEQLAPL